MYKNDKLLEIAFTDDQLWEDAIEAAVVKGISKKELIDLCTPDVKIAMYTAVRDGKYQIAPPRTAKIPKDEPGEYRIVYINENIDRVLLSLINLILFRECSNMVHRNCRSYQRGVSCGDVVIDASKFVAASGDGPVGFKADLSKYFDSVPIEYIDRAFDAVEYMHGKSALIDVARKYYHQDLYWDVENNMELTIKYQSLKQGCAVASWLADVCLYHIDEEITKMVHIYKRYSDDIVCLGGDWQGAMDVLEARLNEMQMKLNPKKVELLDKHHWFKFLGFSIKGELRSLSCTGIKNFQRDIADATFGNEEIRKMKSPEKRLAAAMKGAYKAMYKGYNGYSWAKRVLRVINCDKDLNILNAYVMDCIRASKTGKHKVGGLGFVKDKRGGCIERGKGTNVRANRLKHPHIDGYYTIKCMQNCMLTSMSVYETLVETEM